MTITLSAWIIPAAFTLSSFVLAFALVPRPQPSSYLPDIVPGLIAIFNLSMATILSLAVWLFWALVL
jgi:hypothetical protein